MPEHPRFNPEQPVEKKPIPEVGQPSSGLAEPQAEQQPHDRGVNKPELQLPQQECSIGLGPGSSNEQTEEDAKEHTQINQPIRRRRALALSDPIKGWFKDLCEEDELDG